MSHDLIACIMVTLKHANSVIISEKILIDHEMLVFRIFTLLNFILVILIRMAFIVSLYCDLSFLWSIIFDLSFLSAIQIMQRFSL